MGQSHRSLRLKIMKKYSSKLLGNLILSGLLLASYGCSSDEPSNENHTIKANGHEYVDLGLSVKWATCNIGAESPEDPGFLFAWGETENKDDFTSYNYAFGPISYTGTEITKYCTNENYGVNDGLILLETCDDAANAHMGGDWRMPTRAEIAELMRGCTREYITVNESFCVKFTGPNGNSILLPGKSATDGYTSYVDENRVAHFLRTDKPETGGIWSSSLCVLYEQAQRNAYGLEFHSALPSLAIEVGTTNRCYGMAVRGVIE